VAASKVLVSVPDWFAGVDSGRVMTFARMAFERGTQVFRLHWRDGVVTGLGGDRLAEPCRLWCLPAAGDGDALVTYHLPTGAQSRLRLERGEDGQVLRIEGEGGRVAARDQ
jgi:hypothetical protein